MKTQGRRLTAKQKRFIAEYQKDYNGTRAAVVAGYSERTASELAYQLLQIPLVKQAITRQTEAKLTKIGVHAERILTELVRVALSDTRKLYREDGSLKPPSEWDDETAAAIAGVETFEEFEGRGKDRTQIGWTKKVRVFDKVRALENLGKHLKLFPEGDMKIDVGISGRLQVDQPLADLELAAKIVYLITLAEEKRKALEAQCSPQVPEKL